MAFLNNVLEPPAYGWTDECGNLSKPGSGQILKEFFSRLNVFKNKKKLAVLFKLDVSGCFGTVFIYIPV